MYVSVHSGHILNFIPTSIDMPLTPQTVDPPLSVRSRDSRRQHAQTDAHKEQLLLIRIVRRSPAFSRHRHRTTTLGARQLTT